MPVFRNKYTTHFTNLPNAAVENTDLSWGARGLLWLLLTKPPTWQVNQKWLETQADSGQFTIRKLIQQLIDTGHINRYKEHADDGTFEWVYDVFALPEENPTRRVLSTMDETSAGSPTDGSTTDGKSRHIVSTDSTSTDIPSTEQLTIISDDQKVEDKPKKPKSNDYTPEFEEAWAAYPRKTAKVHAFASYKARITAGVSPEELLKATENYARIMRKRQTETGYMLHGSTFYGPHERWKDYLDPGTAEGLARNDIVDPDRTGGGYVDVSQIKRPT